MRLFLSGDVMTGRGIDQALAHPVDPQLHEAYVRDARVYVRLAEQGYGRIEKPLGEAAIWGEALAELERWQPDARIINLETSITTRETPWPDKGIHYRMHPRNVGCLAAASIDCCCLANNHVLDWGVAGLVETLATLEGAGIGYAGAGRDAEQAERPAVMGMPGGGRLLVFAAGSETSGIPPQWQAGGDRPGVWLLRDLSLATADDLAEAMQRRRRPGDVVVASIHWGGNWGYGVSPQQQVFARRLIDGGVDLLHGHSSHHVKGMEVYRGRLILYGCGDLLTDYEGISGHEAYRGDLSFLYLPVLGGDGSLERLELVPMQMRGLRLRRPSAEDCVWLHEVVQRESGPFGVRVSQGEAERLVVEAG